MPPPPVGGAPVGNAVAEGAAVCVAGGAVVGAGVAVRVAVAVPVGVAVVGVAALVGLAGIVAGVEGRSLGDCEAFADLLTVAVGDAVAVPVCVPGAVEDGEKIAGAVGDEEGEEFVHAETAAETRTVKVAQLTAVILAEPAVPGAAMRTFIEASSYAQRATASFPAPGFRHRDRHRKRKRCQPDHYPRRPKQVPHPKDGHIGKPVDVTGVQWRVFHLKIRLRE